MFETAELGLTISKEEYRKLESELRTQLLDIQEDLKKAQFPVIILIGGVDGAGKGETVNLLHEWMDARYLKATSFGQPTDEEEERPLSWRFWRVLPPRGRIGILFGSWYTRPIIDHVFGKIPEAELDASLSRINFLEKELVDDGALIIKFWFHLSKKAQKKRLNSLCSDPKTKWRVTPTDWKHFKLYDRFRQVSERSLRATSTGEAPWIIIEGADRRYRSITVAKHILETISERLSRPVERRSPAEEAFVRPSKTLLDTIDLSAKLDPPEYRAELEQYQGKLNLRYRKARKEGQSAVLVFEGWDAAGKGGIIRRITAAMDSRDYQVIPIAAPTEEEKAQHYLWRFWRHVPRAGHLAIFDRSWYGRVLVERVEGFAKADEWKRAYSEIVNFEEELTRHGIILLKFWVHIDKDEQLRRFTERHATSHKHYKITDEDFRNREKWDAYELAANEMIERTSTEFAPWHLIPANDKNFARIKVLKTFCSALKRFE